MENCELTPCIAEGVMLPLQKRNDISPAGGIFGRKRQFLLFHTLVLVFFSHCRVHSNLWRTP
jgi:hypothetical protein